MYESNNFNLLKLKKEGEIKMLDKKYIANEKENKWLNYWKENGIYDFKLDYKEVYSIDTPPPTVNGKIHIGHVFSYTQTEMIARYKRLSGYNVFYPFGFDDNGLPSERLVEKEQGKKAHEIGREEFSKLCYETTDKYESEFQELFSKMGVSTDWKYHYKTVSPSTIKISQRSFLDLINKGHCYHKESPALWCNECLTSIAQAELETKTIKTTFNYIKFKTKEDNEEFTIATTRPELLPAIVCVFVNPNDDKHNHLIGKTAHIPVINVEVPIMADEKVAIDKGTGVVMCCTFGDQTDIEWWKKYNLPLKYIFTDDGRIIDSVPNYGGMKIKEARKQIIDDLQAGGYVVKIEELEHEVQTHERCGKEVEYAVMKQWFIDIMNHKDDFIRIGNEINWYPEHMHNRYNEWVENIMWDWCISRQRYFGVPFPVWYCKKCGKPIFAEESQLPVNPLEQSPLKACTCGCNEFIPETAVFDTWATSSVTPLINAHYKETDDISDEIFPMGMRSQAHEIIRTWAFYTIVKSLYHTGQVPWKDIMISGFVLAKPGEKISKSKNNASNSPMMLIEKHSADAMRYWAANSKLGTDTFFSEEELKISKRFLNKLYNASKFVILQLNEFTPENAMKEEKMLPIDRWIMERVNETTIRAAQLLNEFEIGQARHEIDELFWSDFCDFYIEIAKERLYQPQKHGEENCRSGQTALYYSLLGILKLYAIYTPYMTDYIFQEYYRQYEKEISLHQTIWQTKTTQTEYLEFGEHVKATLTQVRKDKTQKQMSMKDPIEKLTITCPKAYREFYQKTLGDLYACTAAEKIMIRS